MSLKVKCTNGDCEWTGELVDYSKHVVEICPNRVVQCKYDCSQHFLAKDIATHEGEGCIKRPVEQIVEQFKSQVERKKQQQIEKLREEHQQEILSLHEKIQKLQTEKIDQPKGKI